MEMPKFRNETYLYLFVGFVLVVLVYLLSRVAALREAINEDREQINSHAVAISNTRVGLNCPPTRPSVNAKKGNPVTKKTPSKAVN